MQPKQYSIFSLPVIVGSLGFFVDIYDLLLFSIVRKSSFKELGVAEAAMKNIGENIISWQMLGLTIGGILWGILGDKKGRKSVLFGSIVLYSLATIATGFVTSSRSVYLAAFYCRAWFGGGIRSQYNINK